MSPDLDALGVPASRAPGSGRRSMLPSQWEHDGMQVIDALLDVIAFTGVLVVGMALVPWLVDGVR